MTLETDSIFAIPGTTLSIVGELDNVVLQGSTLFNGDLTVDTATVCTGSIIVSDTSDLKYGAVTVSGANVALTTNGTLVVNAISFPEGV
jgi:hypothetical protein